MTSKAPPRPSIIGFIAGHSFQLYIHESSIHQIDHGSGNAASSVLKRGHTGQDSLRFYKYLIQTRERVVAANLVHPSGYISSHSDIYFTNNINGWAIEFLKRQPNITMGMVLDFLINMYMKRADFVFKVDRDFVRNCQTPALVLPDGVPAHPYATAMETALLAPNA